MPNVLDFEIGMEKIICLDENRENGDCYEIETNLGVFRRNPIISYGIVKFIAYGVGNDVIGEYSCYQNEFVELLRKGSFKDINGKRIDLFEEKKESFSVQGALEF